MFLRSRLAQNETITAAAATRTDDLPVNPLSAILLTIKGDVDAINALPSLANLFGIFSRVEVLYKGQSIVSASLADLAALYYFNTGRFPVIGRFSAEADEANWFFTVPILFGPRAFDKSWCFPAVRRGELQLQCTPAASFTALNDPLLQIETIELLDGAPTHFYKYTTIAKTPNATGDHDVDLPLGNPIRSVLLFGTTVPTDAADAPSIQQVRMLVDNVEHGYALANFESLVGEDALFRSRPFQAHEHVHRLGGGAPAADDTTEAAEWPTDFLRNYLHLNYSPHEMDDYLLQTAGKGRVHLRINASTADAIRVIPVEQIAVQGAAGA